MCCSSYPVKATEEMGLGSSDAVQVTASGWTATISVVVERGTDMSWWGHQDCHILMVRVTLAELLNLYCSPVLALKMSVMPAWWPADFGGSF